MSDPPRLSTTHRVGLTAAMLDSARDDAPPASARQRALVAFGAGTGAILTAGMAEGGSGVAAGAAATVGASGASVAIATKVATWVVIAKWAGGGAIVAVCTAAAVANVAPRPSADLPQASRPQSEPSTVRLEPPVVVAPVSVPSPMPGTVAPAAAPATIVAPAAAVVASSPDMRLDPASRGQQASSPRATSARATPLNTGADTAIESAARARDENLAAEVAWLDRASASIRSGDVERGLQVLDDYNGRFPGGVLTPESQVLRIEALVRKGDRANATRLGEAFLSRTPQSALASRVRSLLLSVQKEQAP
jgi:hypothetical protein